MSTFIQFNNIQWSISLLGEDVALLLAKEEVDIGQIHSSTDLIHAALGEKLNDIVPAYDSIALFTTLPLNHIIDLLGRTAIAEKRDRFSSRTFELPICYELGLDWDEMTKHTLLSKEEIIAIHLAGTYRNLFMGFTPGFIYADGLDPRLACTRKKNPRTKVQAGSVGIGGAQTGIYSLDSPGGWNIIGKTPVQLFDMKKKRPTKIDVGDRFRFIRISTEAYERWES